jgi:PAS domain S-box-containing protein
MIDHLLRRLSVRRRIVGGFSVLVLLIAAVIPVIIAYHNFMNHRIQHITQIDAPANRLLSYAATRIMSSRVNLLRYYQDYLPSAWPAVEDVDQAGNLLKQAKDLMTIPAQKNNIISVLKIIDNYNILIQDIKIAAAGKERFEATRHVFLTLKTGNSIAQMIEKIVEDNEKRIAETNQAVLVNTQKTLLVIIASFSFVILFSLVLAFAVARSITRSISELRQGADEFRQGNLDIRIPTAGKDELSLLAHTFNNMAENLSITTVSRDTLIQEVSERKKTEAALKKSEDTLKSIFRAAPIGIGLVSERVLLWVNEHLYSMLGYTSDELVGQSARMLYPSQEDFDWVEKEKYKQIHKYGTGTVETRWQRKDGDIIDVLLSSTPLDTSDLSAGVTFTALDLTKRKHAEDSLRRERERLSTILDGNPISIFMIDQDHRVVFWNRAFETLSMKPREQALGKTLSESLAQLYAKKTPPILADLILKMTDEDLLKRYSIKIRRAGFGESFEATVSIWPGGQKRILDIIATRIRDHQGKVLGAIQCAQDVTEKKRLEDQLLQSQKMESIGTLAGGIAHDFNNILGIILGYTELSMDDIPEWNPARLNLEEIRTATFRAKNVVRQLLSFARKTKLEKKPTNIIPIVEESLKLLRSSIPTSIEIRQNISKDVDTILADSTQINQILINLCTNADHAMPDGGVIVVTLKNVELGENVTAQYPDLNSGRYVNLTISDTGHGIPKEETDRIFDPYFTTKEMGKGTGMGLAVVHGIVKEHNGIITVESELGKGTMFSIFFPVVEKEAVVETETDEELPIGDERILFIDDEESIVKLGHQRLERLGYKVKSTTNPIEALDLFRSEPDQFDLVITDQTMPKMTGENLVKEILNIRPDIPTILCTGFSEKIDEKKAKEIGTTEYIEKPLDKLDFASKVRNVLDAE